MTITFWVEDNHPMTGERVGISQRLDLDQIECYKGDFLKMVLTDMIKQVKLKLKESK